MSAEKRRNLADVAGEMRRSLLAGHVLGRGECHHGPTACSECKDPAWLIGITERDAIAETLRLCEEALR